MALRPDRQLAYTSIGLTAIILGLAFWFAPDRGHSLYYSARWQLHDTYYAGCDDCHRPFARVTSNECLPCHQKFEEGFDPDELIVYLNEESERQAAEEKKNRNLHAQLLYHALPAIAAIDCVSCHPEHQPPTHPHGFAFAHQHGRHLPRGTLSLQECFHCHTPHQAPRDHHHVLYFDHGNFGTDCSACHGSTVDWRLDAINAATAHLREGEFVSILNGVGE